VSKDFAHFRSQNGTLDFVAAFQARVRNFACDKLLDGPGACGIACPFKWENNGRFMLDLASMGAS
jgi:hypothetical protein